MPEGLSKFHTEQKKKAVVPGTKELTPHLGIYYSSESEQSERHIVMMQLLTFQ